MGDTLGVTVLSTTGLSGHDGCHYAWAQGYREMGDHAFAVVARDLYQGPAEGVAPPNPAVSYLDHLRAGPRIVNATGAGLLAFHDLPIG